MIDEIIEEQQLKFGLSKERIKAVVMSEYTYLNNLIEDGDLESVRIPGFGLFVVKPFRKIQLDKDQKRDEQRELKDYTNRDYSRKQELDTPDKGE